MKKDADIKKVVVEVSGPELIVNPPPERFSRVVGKSGLGRVRQEYKNEKEEDCLPGVMLKQAILDACEFIPAMDGLKVRASIFVEGELVPLLYEQTRMRWDTFRIGLHSTMKQRRCYLDWKAMPTIQYDANNINETAILGLLSVAGERIGVGDWRLGKGGRFGGFKVRLVHGKQEIAHESAPARSA
jgi:hypothetical protein